MASIVAGDGISVDATDPANPVVSALATGKPWWFAPPLAADLIAGSADATLPVMTDDDDEGLLIDFGTHVTGNIDRYVWKALPGGGVGSWEVVVKLNISVAQVSSITGLMAWESATGKTLLLNQNTTTREIRIDRQTALNSALTNMTTTSQSAVPKQAEWFKMSYDAVADKYHVNVSTNGKQWRWLNASSIITRTTPFTTRADRIALFSWSAGSNTEWTRHVSCDHWAQSW